MEIKQEAMTPVFLRNLVSLIVHYFSFTIKKRMHYKFPFDINFFLFCSRHWF